MEIEVHRKAQDPTDYWLFAWLASHKIKTSSQLRAAFDQPSTLRELRELAEQWSASVKAQPVGNNLVAGTGLRLDDTVTCPGPACRRQQVDVLFRHAWHYFDRVLLPDGVGDLLLNPPKGLRAAYVQDMVVHSAGIVLYIQQIGATPLVSYYPVSDYSVQVTNKAQDSNWGEAWDDVEATLAAQGRYTFEETPEGLLARCSDPFLGVQSQFLMELATGEIEDEELLRAEVAHITVHEHIAALQRDLIAARKLAGSLGSAVWSHERVLSRLSKGPNDSDVLFRISFPSPANVPIRELVSLRTAEGDAFEAFRNALAKAARELSATRPSLSPQNAAAEIVRDVVEPQLAALRQRLRSAKRALARKAPVSIALAGVSTLCGVMLGGSALTAAAAGGIGFVLSGAGSAVSKFLDEKQSIEMSDMFFLWTALQHAD